MTRSITISGLTVCLLLKSLYKINIPNLNKSSIYKYVKQAHYGGIAEVYKPSGTDLDYYDVYSLYPYAALQNVPSIISIRVFFSKEKKLWLFFCSIKKVLHFSKTV